MKILAISGSLRDDSFNTKLLRAAPELAPDGVEVELWKGLKAVPPYDQDDDVDPAPAEVARLRAALAGADAVLFSTPEYNSSIPGQLKNALDWVSRPLAANPARNKPAAVVGASKGAFGAVWAQAELRKVLAAIGARVVEGELTIKGRTQPVELRGTIADPITDPYGRERIGLTLAGSIDRTSFGIDWNNPLPSGEPALANEVQLSAELYLVKA